MPTGVDLAEDKRFVESQGYSVDLLNEPAQRGTWYRPDGLAIKNQPVDPYARGRNRAKGWTLTPPEQPVQGEEPVQVGLGVSLPSAVERAAELGIKVLDIPPKHVHVMRGPIGAPCLVLGCIHIRAVSETRFKSKGKNRNE